MSVIFSRAPLRISLGGGGTDLPSYYAEHEGFLMAGAIDKYIYMLIHSVFQRRYKMKYSESEEVETIAEIRHPILRERLARYWRGNPLEIASVAGVPAGTGMGSSGAFTVALLKGLAHARRDLGGPGHGGGVSQRDRDRHP
jgi:D-glycero-alpha-D-manno-heptose-7-phosphate kinase